MAQLDLPMILDAVLRILLVEEESIALTFTGSGVFFKFPTTRHIAEYLKVPHYYVLPLFGMLEKQQLITKAERVGIMTTAEGSTELMVLLDRDYREQGIALLGPVIYRELQQNLLRD
ncbi:hypothetical protein [Methanosphaerula subterraneus]|uniref:hypothetical protein n=1 Tax=Methanosphaerula subterraneus TaxID=3350244 RepID=UPI003F846C47